MICVKPVVQAFGHSLWMVLLLLLPGVCSDGLSRDMDSNLLARGMGPARLGMRHRGLLGAPKLMGDTDSRDMDDSDFLFSTNVRARSSVGGLSGPPALVGGANLLSTGPGTVTANIGGTYDILGGGMYDVLGGPDPGLDFTFGLGSPGLLTKGFGRSGLGGGLRGFKPLGPKLTYVRPNRNKIFGPTKRRSRPRFKPFGRRRGNFWWKGRYPRLFGRKCRKWGKRFRFFG